MYVIRLRVPLFLLKTILNDLQLHNILLINLTIFINLTFEINRFGHGFDCSFFFFNLGP